MIKKYKKTLIASSLALLIPVIVGLLLWDKLPDPMPSHWNIHGEVDGWCSKAFGVLGLPAIMLAMQWVCIFASMADPKYQNYNPKMIKLMFWICPVIGLVLCCMVYPQAMGYSVPIEVIMPLLMGVLFIVVGNWMPKCKQTYTMGIKLPWTLNSEANWNATHRFGGKVWVIGGILTMLTAFLGSFWLMMAILLLIAILPTVYSYLYYRNHEKDEHNGN